ncbi:MAG TPA: tetratricopeptide repeat protein [Chthonomonadales bacterium]|nr:tetratricopeptide repeat protein [Chthonomonadales bacterium]
MLRQRIESFTLMLAMGALLALCIEAEAQKSARQPLTGAKRAEAIAAAVIDRLWQLSDAHWHKGEYLHVVNLSRMIVAAQPYDLDTYANAGYLLWSLNRDDEALAWYKQGIRDNPNTAYLYDEVGIFYVTHRRDHAGALPYLEKAASLKDCPPRTLHTLAHAYEKTGKLDKALATWQRAVKHPDNPNRAAAQRNLERLQRLMKKPTTTKK